MKSQKLKDAASKLSLSLQGFEDVYVGTGYGCPNDVTDKPCEFIAVYTNNEEIKNNLPKEYEGFIVSVREIPTAF